MCPSVEKPDYTRYGATDQPKHTNLKWQKNTS